MNQDFFERLEEYFDQRADADQPSGSTPTPNEEMRFLMEVRQLKENPPAPAAPQGEAVAYVRLKNGKIDFDENCLFLDRAAAEQDVKEFAQAWGNYSVGELFLAPPADDEAVLLLQQVLDEGMSSGMVMNIHSFLANKGVR